ncbi:MAG: thioredoxin family protein [Gammaproteobacteria bacterium]
MTVKLIATRTCRHAPLLARELDDIGIEYQWVYIEDSPQVAVQHGVRHSPCLLVDDQLLCFDQPTEGELRRLLQARRAQSPR